MCINSQQGRGDEIKAEVYAARDQVQSPLLEKKKKNIYIYIYIYSLHGLLAPHQACVSVLPCLVKWHQRTAPGGHSTPRPPSKCIFTWCTVCLKKTPGCFNPSQVSVWVTVLMGPHRQVPSIPMPQSLLPLWKMGIFKRANFTG
jgi:hypothetical protein